MARFKDYFSGTAEVYRSARPGYPDALYDWVASQAPARQCVWDCGAGSGQASLPLTQRFDQVIASDASQAQVRRMPAAKGLNPLVARAEAPPLTDGSVDAVTVAQALHWFDADRFHRAVRTVLCPGGIVVAWTYGHFLLGGRLDTLVSEWHQRWVERWWPDERRHVESGYRTLPWPWAWEGTPPELSMEADWNLAELLAYVGTWSAVQQCRAAGEPDPVAKLHQTLAGPWGHDTARRRVRWPVRILAGRKP